MKVGERIPKRKRRESNQVPFIAPPSEQTFPSQPPHPSIECGDEPQSLP